MRVEAKWTGDYPNLCSGQWILKVNNKDVSHLIPEELRNEPMNTYCTYQRWNFYDNWEEKWDSISDIEKVSILLYDTEITDRFKQPQKRKKKCSKVICPINKEYNNLSQGKIEMDSQTTISSFLGKPIIINDSLCEQIAFIANQDKMLSYSDSIVQIGNVRWRINLMPNVIALMTSVQPDDQKMKHVVEYLNSIYGKPYQDDEDGYSIKWSSSGDSLDIFKPGSTLVHLRRVHTEEGGTFLFFK